MRTSRPELLLLSCLVLLGPLTAWAQALPSPLRQAQTCYARDDLGCVVDVLGPSGGGLTDDAREGLRLLAFAYARLDRHADARKAFGQWLQRFADARLERATTPPVVWQDYAAAQLDVLGPQLDTRPQLVEPAALPPPVTASDLPAFSPPPPSGRDQARDFQFVLAAGVGLEVGGASRPTLLGAGQLAVELLPEPWLWGVAIGGRGVRLRTDAETDPLHYRVPVLLRGGRRLVGGAEHGLWLMVGAGVHYGSAPSPLVSVGVRYTRWGHGVAGLCLELRDDVDLSTPSHTGLALLGACLRPQASSAKGDPP